MRRLLFALVCSLALGAFVAPLRAAPILTIDLKIDNVTAQIQFLDDLTLLYSCDGSVLVACDGSVRPIDGASFRLTTTGAVTALTPVEMLGDGSVRVLGDGSVVPSEDSLRINALSYSPNPFFAAMISVVDLGEPSSFAVTIGGPMSLSGSAYQYALTGSISITGEGATAAPTQGISDTILSGRVDGLTVVGIGDLLYTEGFTDLGTDTGMANCTACSFFGMGAAFDGSGEGADYRLTLTFDVNDATAVVPIPSSIALMALGLLGFLGRRQRFIARAAPARAS